MNPKYPCHEFGKYLDFWDMINQDYKKRQDEYWQQYFNGNSSDRENKGGSKSRKLDVKHLEIERQSALICQQPVEILEYMFDYLPLEDLCGMSETCKWMQQVAGQFYRLNYPGIVPSIVWKNNRYHEGDLRIRCGIVHHYSMDNFVKYFDKIRLSSVEKCCIESFLHQYVEFHQLRKLYLHAMKLFQVKSINFRMEGVLNHLEYLKISDCTLDEDMIGKMFTIAPNIKHLSMHRVTIENTDGKQAWCRQNYPNLKCCEIFTNEFIPIVNLLKLNPNIRKFGVALRNICMYKSFLSSSKINLDELSIHIWDTSEQGLLLNYIILNELHQRGFYKRLKLYITHGVKHRQNYIDEIATLTGLVKLHIGPNSFSERILLPTLKHLEHINFYSSNMIMNVEHMATHGCENLEQIHFGKSTINHVQLFISRNSNLKKLRVDYFTNGLGSIEYDKVLNLFELNEERAKLPNAKKVTLYVEESAYLASKEAKPETDLSLIQLKRAESYECDDDIDIINELK